jgi:quercetin dioxygenase-like cupin family protein
MASLSIAWGAAPAASAPPPATVAQLLSRDLVPDDGREVVMLTVTYAPGGSSPPHRHDAQVFVYVLEGALTMQVHGGAAVTLHPGETFYEAPDDIHAVSANASRVAPAKFLVIMVKDKKRPGSRPVSP